MHSDNQPAVFDSRQSNSLSAVGGLGGTAPARQPIGRFIGCAAVRGENRRAGKCQAPAMKNGRCRMHRGPQYRTADP